MRKGIITSSILTLSLLSLVIIALGLDQGTWGSRLHGGRNRVGAERLLRLLDSDGVRIYLGLTDPQVDRLRQIIVDTQKANVRIRAELAVQRIEMRETLRADKPDRNEVLKKVQEISDLRREMMKDNVEAILAAKSILSHEQQRKVFSLFEDRHEGMPFGERPGGVRANPLPTPGVPPPVPLHPGEPPVQ